MIWLALIYGIGVLGALVLFAWLDRAIPQPSRIPWFGSVTLALAWPLLLLIWVGLEIQND